MLTGVLLTGLRTLIERTVFTGEKIQPLLVGVCRIYRIRHAILNIVLKLQPPYENGGFFVGEYATDFDCFANDGCGRGARTYIARR
jgi:hypothetical protein